MLRPSRHADTFTRDHLPPADQWPELLFELPALQFPDLLNCGEVLLDAALDAVGPDQPAIYYGDQVWTYGRLAATANQFAHVLSNELAVRPGERVLLHGANRPELFALWLAVMKVGGVAVTTMPLLRARELAAVVAKAEVRVALGQYDLLDELDQVRRHHPQMSLFSFGDSQADMEIWAGSKPGVFAAVPTSQDDVCLIAFTSGTTGQPKATLHFHRDVLAMCVTFADHHLAANTKSVFCGTPPIAFTFGLGALLVFPLYFRAAVALPDRSTPGELAAAISRFRATHVFTSPTAYRALLPNLEDLDLDSVEVYVSAGEALSKATWEQWRAKTGSRIIDGIGATEMIHIFISAAGQDIRPGATGKPAPGYVAALLDDANRVIEGAGEGRLAVKGPTGCRYLADARQTDYVRNGWNLTGDIYRRDEEGYYWYVARADDMIVSSGYNIAGPEVEAALALHAAVRECAVVGWPDGDRGQVVKAFVVVNEGHAPGAALAEQLQLHVKAILAPYKYPRAVAFVAELPKTATGKLQRKALLPSGYGREPPP